MHPSNFVSRASNDRTPTIATFPPRRIGRRKANDRHFARRIVPVEKPEGNRVDFGVLPEERRDIETH